MSTINFSFNKFLEPLETGALKALDVDRLASPIQIDITNACNLSCSRCDHSHQEDEFYQLINELIVHNRIRIENDVILAGNDSGIIPQGSK